MELHAYAQVEATYSSKLPPLALVAPAAMVPRREPLAVRPSAPAKSPASHVDGSIHEWLVQPLNAYRAARDGGKIVQDAADEALITVKTPKAQMGVSLNILHGQASAMFPRTYTDRFRDLFANAVHDVHRASRMIPDDDLGQDLTFDGRQLFGDYDLTVADAARLTVSRAFARASILRDIAAFAVVDHQPRPPRELVSVCAAMTALAREMHRFDATLKVAAASPPRTALEMLRAARAKHEGSSPA